jgi:hypothetical protein
MPWMVVRKYPMWFYSILRFEIFINAGSASIGQSEAQFSYSKTCTFPTRREAQPSEDSRADLIALLHAGSTPQATFPFFNSRRIIQA